MFIQKGIICCLGSSELALEYISFRCYQYFVWGRVFVRVDFRFFVFVVIFLEELIVGIFCFFDIFIRFFSSLGDVSSWEEFVYQMELFGYSFGDVVVVLEVQGVIVVVGCFGVDRAVLSRRFFVFERTDGARSRIFVDYVQVSCIRRQFGVVEVEVVVYRCTL